MMAASENGDRLKSGQILNKASNMRNLALGEDNGSSMYGY
jgi:hypothetical protein